MGTRQPKLYVLKIFVPWLMMTLRGIVYAFFSVYTIQETRKNQVNPYHKFQLKILGTSETVHLRAMTRHGNSLRIWVRLHNAGNWWEYKCHSFELKILITYVSSWLVNVVIHQSTFSTFDTACLIRETHKITRHVALLEMYWEPFELCTSSRMPH